MTLPRFPHFGAGARAGLIESLRASLDLRRTLTAPKVMETPPTLAAGTATTLPKAVYLGASEPSYRTFSGVDGGHLTLSRTYRKGGGYAIDMANTVTAGNVEEPNATSQVAVSFIHEGEAFELQINAAATGFLVMVDDEYVSLTPQTVGPNTVFKYTFPSRSARRVDVIGQALSFIAVRHGETDVVVPAPRRGPRVVIVGDSFTSAAASSWPGLFASIMGWDDVWVSGVGGTGYVADGGGKKNWLERVESDVIAFRPDIVIALGSINDNGKPTAQVSYNANRFVEKILGALPGVLLIGGMNGTRGVEQMNSLALANMDATKDAYVSNGAVWLNPVEMPVSFTESQGNWTTLRMEHPAGRTGAQGLWVYSSTSGYSNIRIGSVVEIGEGSTRERLRITGTGASGGTQLLYFDGALQYTHPVDAKVREVGPSYLTGKGYVGAETGSGNADILCSSDGVHPSTAGHMSLAVTVAGLVGGYLHGII